MLDITRVLLTAYSIYCEQLNRTLPLYRGGTA